MQSMLACKYLFSQSIVSDIGFPAQIIIGQIMVFFLLLESRSTNILKVVSGFCGSVDLLLDV